MYRMVISGLLGLAERCCGPTFWTTRMTGLEGCSNVSTMTKPQQMRRHKLQRDSALEFEILGLVNDTHAAPAELGQDLVVGDRLADHDSQIVALRDNW